MRLPHHSSGQLTVGEEMGNYSVIFSFNNSQSNTQFTDKGSYWEKWFQKFFKD